MVPRACFRAMCGGLTGHSTLTTRRTPEDVPRINLFVEGESWYIRADPFAQRTIPEKFDSLARCRE